MFHRVEEGALGLIGRRIAQLPAGCAAIPEGATEEQAFDRIVIEQRSYRHIICAGRLAIAETLGNGSGIYRTFFVDTGDGADKTSPWRVAGGAGDAIGTGDILEEDLLAQFISPSGCRPKILCDHCAAQCQERHHYQQDV